MEKAGGGGVHPLKILHCTLSWTRISVTWHCHRTDTPVPGGRVVDPRASGSNGRRPGGCRGRQAAARRFRRPCTVVRPPAGGARCVGSLVCARIPARGGPAGHASGGAPPSQSAPPRGPLVARPTLLSSPPHRRSYVFQSPRWCSEHPSLSLAGKPTVASSSRRREGRCVWQREEWRGGGEGGREEETRREVLVGGETVAPKLLRLLGVPPPPCTTWAARAFVGRVERRGVPSVFRLCAPLYVCPCASRGRDRRAVVGGRALWWVGVRGGGEACNSVRTRACARGTPQCGRVGCVQFRRRGVCLSDRMNPTASGPVRLFRTLFDWGCLPLPGTLTNASAACVYGRRGPPLPVDGTGQGGHSY